MPLRETFEEWRARAGFVGERLAKSGAGLRSARNPASLDRKGGLHIRGCLLSVPCRKALPRMGRAFQFVDHRDGVILN
jgi:hypothetical protein